ncbi:hypothetical protein RI129_002821 [Pyrocoelia pectoralis]|uniref:Integrase core domain-containing protein n=1 Tax=Pyrocoelia pectoralis TaxID=417401 RepID=A0AAN7VQE2_9COLE
MYLKCLQSNLVVTQETVRQLLQIIDPIGVKFRPNFLWHIDSYDKLKPFGICINVSRHIMWLKAGINSSGPKIIGGYYLETLKLIYGFPQTIRCDLGTENGIVERIQRSLATNAVNSTIIRTLPPFLYGTSPANQRIEAWWSILRKHHAQFWMNVFHKLKDDGFFSGSFLDKALIQFCFLKIIQEELDTVVIEWNTHKISGSKNSVCPRGRPFIMYHMPQLFGTKNYLCQLPRQPVDMFDEHCTFFNNIPCDEDVYQLAAIVMDEERLTIAKEPSSAIHLYLNLRSKMLNMIHE